MIQLYFHRVEKYLRLEGISRDNLAQLSCSKYGQLEQVHQNTILSDSECLHNLSGQPAPPLTSLMMEKTKQNMSFPTFKYQLWYFLNIKNVFIASFNLTVDTQHGLIPFSLLPPTSYLCTSVRALLNLALFSLNSPTSFSLSFLSDALNCQSLLQLSAGEVFSIGDSTTSLATLLQCSATLTTKKFFYMFVRNL